MAPNLAAQGLSYHGIGHKYKGARALDDVNFTAPAGAVTCIIGASGAGKSTLLRLTAGLERVQSGQIRLNGEVLASAKHDPPPERRPIGLVFQDLALFPHMSVADNVGFGLSKLSASERRTVVHQYLDDVGLGGMGDRMPHTLSGGEQQRAALARALAPKPRVVLMDEPYASVDPSLRRSLREDARLSLKASGAVVILVTHDPAEAMELGDRIVVLSRGKVVQMGAPNELYDKPQSPEVCAALGDAQLVRARVCGSILETELGPVELLAPPRAALQGRSVISALRESALRINPSVNGEGGFVVRDVRFASGRWLALASRDNGAPSHRLLRVALEPGQSVNVGDRVGVKQARPGAYVFAPNAPVEMSHD